MAEVVVENGYMMHDVGDGECNDVVGCNKEEFGIEGEGTQANMDMQEQFHSPQVGCISNDFDMNEFEREEEEQEEEDRISDAVSSSSDESDDEHGGTDAMPTSVAPMPVPVHAMPSPVPREVLHAMLTQGRLVHDLPEHDTPYDSWGRISEAQQYVPPPPYIAIELMQLRDEVEGATRDSARHRGMCEEIGHPIDEVKGDAEEGVEAEREEVGAKEALGVDDEHQCLRMQHDAARLLSGRWPRTSASMSSSSCSIFFAYDYNG
jgi:hypothetical protein